MDENDKNLDSSWFKKHAETLTVIASLFGGFIWMDSKFSLVDAKFDKVNERLSSAEKDIGERLSAVEKDIGNLRIDIAVIKTVLSFKGINCPELVAKEEKNKE